MEKLRQKKWFPWVLAISLFLLTLTSRICLAYFYPVDGPGDGVIYTQIAKNILEQNVYSLESAAPYTPTLVRLPGYPLFIAGVYSVFGHDNNTAVRVVQAVFDTFTCVIIALLVLLWTEDEERKRKNAFWAFILSALCPFIAIYAATLLTETLATFLMALMALTATFALKAASAWRSSFWWIFTGLIAGVAVLLRPDSGLFAAGLGLTLVIAGLFLQTEVQEKFLVRLWRVVWKGALFSLAFILALTPWTVRNERLFGVFQPLAPAHAEMPGEFVPHGYERWLRTWVDDFRFVEPTLWNLDEKPIRIAKIPERDFDSPEERDRVAALLEQYNNPPGSGNQYKKADDENDSADADTGDDKTDDSGDNGADPGDEQSSDSTDGDAVQSSDDSSDDDDENKKFIVKMTPEIDAGFAAIADERIERSPVRYYLFLPAKRAAALWFDSHSLYYPFGGQMSPISDLDYDVDQQYWLPAFTLVMWIYTLLGVGGIVVLWRRRTDKNTLQWLILLALMTLPRIIFFSTVANPEPRYVVELFAFMAVLGGFFLGNLGRNKPVMEETRDAQLPPDRLLSLDVFRGLTIAAMVLVNEPGTWSAVYEPLTHSEWNGATPADWVFPFFLFIVGISIALALGKQADEGKAGRTIHFKIIRRSILLFALGVLLEIFPFYNIWTAAWFDPSTLRIMGILQRIAICYLVASLIFLHTNWKRQTVIVLVILLVYWALMTLINVPGCEVTTLNDRACNLAAYIDQTILGANHIWEQSKVLDPEGLLSTLPAIAT
ncbi:MAG: heparan-alpha-glucosaminide N-acetyltransferase domain-containing protein, partial [Acidobacteriota bacterium]